MAIWRRRPDAQQLGKLWPPSQPADNFEPPACVRAFVPVVQPRNDHINYQQHRRQRRATNTSVFISWYPYLGKLALGSEKGGRKTRVGCTFLYFSLAFLPQDRRLAALPRHANSRNSCRNHLKRVKIKKGNSAGRARPFPPHCCRGMRPENYLVVQVEEKAQPARRGGVCAENRHFIQQISYSSTSGHQESPRRGAGVVGGKIWLCNNPSRLSLLLLLL